jgi:hypothetical protein
METYARCACPGLQPSCRIAWKQVLCHVLCANFTTAVTAAKAMTTYKASFKCYEVFDSAIWDSDRRIGHVIVKFLYEACLWQSLTLWLSNRMGVERRIRRWRVDKRRQDTSRQVPHVPCENRTTQFRSHGRCWAGTAASSHLLNRWLRRFRSGSPHFSAATFSNSAHAARRNVRKSTAMTG